MARKKRVWYPGAEYHVMNRGNRRGDIFRTKQDYEVYLMLLAKAKVHYPFYLLGYCLMTNHVHLHIRTIEVELFRIIQYVHFNYSRYFNETYNLIGHLFQGRYFAQLIEDDEYVLVTSRYIQLNPVKAKMVSQPSDYKWSSYHELITNEQNGYIKMDRDVILNYFYGDREKQYQRFVEEHQYNDKDMTIAQQMEDEEIICQL